ncbi:sulfur carrier protein ThiS adenylyltransferase ThiF [Lactobacillus sp. ESL0679]|uniref:sulfur carrier protein ThiS adenylyltransferase ThiF n=1 Tax=Lactobacillus sp. ESL0679 TaxID=2983209 RepID=UPI0023F6A669|nr:sulfur carrier protein ThiS adenylyltransferase ThiF [Lactobacillus sp. ESL0679]MDF7682820.1 sulfur carrier protein ThiS adenylyltransferase ThiF [Lactobacillus sp. ESL0679]
MLDRSRNSAVVAEMQKRNVSGSSSKLAAAKVTIAGCGGLGTNISLALARIGVGQITLIDFDQVELSNLNRQQFKFNQVGMAKVVAMKENLQEVNPFVTVKAIKERVTLQNIAQLFQDADIICEAFDDPAAKAMLLENVTTIFPDKPLVMASGMAGIHSANAIKTRKILPNVYLAGDGKSKGTEGLMAPRVTICAGHEANMIVQLILGIEDLN